MIGRNSTVTTTRARTWSVCTQVKECLAQNIDQGMQSFLLQQGSQRQDIEYPVSGCSVVGGDIQGQNALMSTIKFPTSPSDGIDMAQRQLMFKKIVEEHTSANGRKDHQMAHTCLHIVATILLRIETAERLQPWTSKMRNTFGFSDKTRRGRISVVRRAPKELNRDFYFQQPLSVFGIQTIRKNPTTQDRKEILELLYLEVHSPQSVKQEVPETPKSVSFLKFGNSLTTTVSCPIQAAPRKQLRMSQPTLSLNSRVRKTTIRTTTIATAVSSNSNRNHNHNASKHTQQPQSQQQQQQQHKHSPSTLCQFRIWQHHPLCDTQANCAQGTLARLETGWTLRGLRCALCPLSFNYKKSTSSMLRHFHDEPCEPTLSDTAKAKLNQSLAQLICCGLQPFSIVENAAFRAFVHELNPAFTLPTRSHLRSTQVPLLHSEVMDQIKHALADSYAVYIASLCNIWSPLKIFAFNCDGGSNVKAQQLRFMQIPCGCHLLQLTVKALLEKQISVIKLRLCITTKLLLNTNKVTARDCSGYATISCILPLFRGMERTLSQLQGSSTSAAMTQYLTVLYEDFSPRWRQAYHAENVHNLLSDKLATVAQPSYLTCKPTSVQTNQ
ncbi:hypothetical protein Pelo_9737 [Pelomyxa schiedti]|nr:hypothetical protein Pelo_9737 [Pelomyxa schiedti]